MHETGIKRARSVRMARFARRAKGKRGAAMVEALIVLTVFITIDIALVYLRDGYDKRLVTMRDSRKAVWAQTLKACQGGGGANFTGGGGDGSMGMVSGQMATAKGIAVGQTLQKPLETTLTTGKGTSSENAIGHDTMHGALPAISVTTTATTLCGEKQASISQGDIRATINSLYGSFL